MSVLPKSQARIEKEIKKRFTESELLISSNAKAFLFGEYLIFHAGTSLITGINSRMMISFKFFNKTRPNDEEVRITKIYEKDPSGIYIDLTQRLTKDWIEIIKDSCIKWKDALKKVLSTIKHPMYNDKLLKKIDNLCIDLFIVSNVIYRGGLGSSAVIASIISLAVMNKLGIVSDKLTPQERTLIFLVAIILEDAYHHGKRYIKNLKGIAGGFSVLPCTYPLKKGELFQLDLTKLFTLQQDEESRFKEIPINEFITKIHEIGDIKKNPMITPFRINPGLLDNLHLSIYFSGTRHIQPNEQDLGPTNEKTSTARNTRKHQGNQNSLRNASLKFHLTRRRTQKNRTNPERIQLPQQGQ